MRRFIKILKWTGIAILLIIAGLSLTIAFRQRLTYTAPYPDIKASTDPSVIARGKHLVFGPAHCINCHSAVNPDSLLSLGQEVALAGAVAFRLPVGIIYSRNITPDSATGIGAFTDAEIARALRYGVHPNGTAVYDFMAMHDMSDEDLRAVISYLRAQKAVKNIVPPNQLNLLGHAVQAFMVKPVGPSGPIPANVPRDSSAAYGKYLTLSIAECSGCHTQRNVAGAYTGPAFAGGANIDGFITPNLTPHPGGRIFHWTQQEFIDRFRKGKLIPTSPMPWNSFGRMSDDELKAIYQFLKTVKPAPMPALH